MKEYILSFIAYSQDSIHMNHGLRTYGMDSACRPSSAIPIQNIVLFLGRAHFHLYSQVLFFFGFFSIVFLTLSRPRGTYSLLGVVSRDTDLSDGHNGVFGGLKEKVECCLMDEVCNCAGGCNQPQVPSSGGSSEGRQSKKVVVSHCPASCLRHQKGD
ncbi:hypothetical protein K402DRAFT_53950 [Aulographum hederae CBS 113979]|uniref:Uncharacterized protein n=1 Tax=Aulographum hederae CBS 113979 TaxID=1176131 RepID=A0A6G1H1W0_9PEZI|nr:hypothetical protein K402DRAFT_53950 [Aulographum hederae CBS 113979]